MAQQYKEWCASCGEEMIPRNLKGKVVCCCTNCKAQEKSNIKFYASDTCRQCKSNLIKYHMHGARILQCKACQNSWTEILLGSVKREHLVPCSKCSTPNCRKINPPEDCAIEKIECTSCGEEFNLRWVLPVPKKNKIEISRKEYEKFKRFKGEYADFIRYRENREELDDHIEKAKSLILQIAYLYQHEEDVMQELRELKLSVHGAYCCVNYIEDEDSIWGEEDDESLKDLEIETISNISIVDDDEDAEYGEDYDEGYDDDDDDDDEWRWWNIAERINLNNRNFPAYSKVGLVDIPLGQHFFGAVNDVVGCHD